METLPRELLTNVLSCCSPLDASSILFVCKSWTAIILTEEFFMLACKNHYPNLLNNSTLTENWTARFAECATIAYPFVFVKDRVREDATIADDIFPTFVSTLNDSFDIIEKNIDGHKCKDRCLFWQSFEAISETCITFKDLFEISTEATRYFENEENCKDYEKAIYFLEILRVHASSTIRMTREFIFVQRFIKHFIKNKHNK